jgi:RimJ/RimL family protein N-acetyltransferase
MMRLVCDRQHELLAWAKQRMPLLNIEGSAAAIGVEDGEIIAVAVFDRYRGHDIEISFAADSPRWARRGVIRGIFHYPFVQLGCVRLTTITAENNTRARRLDEGLGFVLEGIHPNGLAPGVTAVSYGMQRSECKWLG